VKQKFFRDSGVRIGVEVLAFEKVESKSRKVRMDFTSNLPTLEAEGKHTTAPFSHSSKFDLNYGSSGDWFLDPNQGFRNPSSDRRRKYQERCGNNVHFNRLQKIWALHHDKLQRKRLYVLCTVTFKKKHKLTL